MAEKKTTSKKAAPKEDTLIEENVGTPEVSSEEILAEQPTEEVEEKEPIEVTPATGEEENEPEAREDVSVEPEFIGDAVPEELEQEENPLEEVEKAVEKFDEVTKNLEDKVAEIEKLEPQKVESAAKETLNEIREMEEELRKEIEEDEKALTPKQRKGMSRWLGDFWNGVSSGWE